ncbi:MAG: hypothetical protein ACI8ZB_003753 [Desulforhopalus sp.]|jgi:hypothetical protein
MRVNLYEGQNVTHKARAEWGIGKILEVKTCGTVMVLFDETRQVSIAKGANHLVHVNKNESVTSTLKNKES